MAYRIIKLVLLLLYSASAFASGLFNTPQQSQFLKADQAFAFSYQQQGAQLNLFWQISPGYYLYRQQIDIQAENASLAPLNLPAGLPHDDEFFGKTEIYSGSLSIPVTINNASTVASIEITYQGCAATGFCYPPQTRHIELQPVLAAPVTSVPAQIAAQSPPPENQPAPSLPFNPLWALLIGIGIAFTPCVLPMYPLISGIVLSGKRLPVRRAMWLAFVYVQGMALTYTLLGVLVALAGLQFQAIFQGTWVLIILSVIFILLALSMFGLFTLQLPSSLQTHLTELSNQQRGGATVSVFSMGAIGGLICSPCTTAPLTAILLYIAQSGSLWQGAGILYLYALGMGLPLILVTVFGNHLLPKSGPWMEQIKIAFGFLILAVPIFLLERLTSERTSLLLWSLLGVTFFAWAFITSLSAHKRWMRIVQIVFLAAALICARPLQDWVFTRDSQTLQVSTFHFQKIDTSEQLSAALEQAKGHPVMIDLYADWCVACKEFKKYTFSDARVQQMLANTVLLQIDMTKISKDNQVLSEHLNILGLPTILFFDPQGKEQIQQRITGFMNADTFLAHLQHLPQPD